MSWKIFALQSAALVLLSWLAGQHYSLPHEENLSAELEKINQRLADLEQTVSRISTAPPSAGAIQSAEKENGGTGESLAHLSQRIEAIEEREKALEKTADSLAEQQTRLVQAQKQAQPEPVRVRNWMSALDEAKKAEVQAAYREQLEQMQKTISVAPDAPPPSPEAMQALLQESRESLKLKLKDILDEAEYQAFLDSLDEGDLPSGLPLLEE